jgi:hypothetical protein
MLLPSSRTFGFFESGSVLNTISKQRNKHLQTTLIEAAKLAPRWSAELAQVYEREKKRGNRNRATRAVARKLVAYLLAVDREERPFDTQRIRVAGNAA